VDKDLTAALLARQLDADVLLLLTDVAAVQNGYGILKARPIRRATPAELRARNFPAGSMGPKIEAVCRCVEATGSWPPSVGRATPSTAHWPSRDPHRLGSCGSPTRYQSATPCWLGPRRGVDVAFGVASADLNATSFNTGMGAAVNRGLSLAARNEIPVRTHPVALGRTRWPCAPLETHGGWPLTAAALPAGETLRKISGRTTYLLLWTGGQHHGRPGQDLAATWGYVDHDRDSNQEVRVAIQSPADGKQHGDHLACLQQAFGLQPEELGAIAWGLSDADLAIAGMLGFTTADIWLQYPRHRTSTASGSVLRLWRLRQCQKGCLAARSGHRLPSPPGPHCVPARLGRAEPGPERGLPPGRRGCPRWRRTCSLGINPKLPSLCVDICILTCENVE
jgi:Amino acid kinase family